MASTPDPTRKSLRNIHAAVIALSILLVASTLVITAAWNGQLAPAAGSDKPLVAAIDSSMLVVDGKDVQTGLIAAEGYLTVKQNCTSCHSAKLILQNHLSRDRWETTIRWMQKNQNLGNLGDNEPIILDYLADNYGPQRSGRRKALETPVWYPLE
jgi:cytochrome c1